MPTITPLRRSCSPAWTWSILTGGITPEVMALADGAGSALGTGGMATKLRAARMVTGSGADMVIANGAHPEVLYDIADGKPAGTRFKGRRQEDLA